MGSEGLISYVKDQHGKPFKLGEHDCFTFTNEAWRIMHGHGYADHFIGKYADLGPKQFAKLMKKSFGHVDLIDALDHGMCRVNHVPPRGAIVVSKSSRPYFTNYALGLAFGLNAVFLGEDDVIFMPISDVDGAWICRR